MSKPKYIETPEKMWELFQAYKKEVKENPRIKVEYVGRNGDKVQTPLEVPLTMEGFSNYLRREDVTTNLHDYLANTNGAYDAYSSICRAIREEVRQDQIEGGMVGQYNASITQRLNGLTEKTQQSVSIEQPIFKGIDLNVSENNGSGQDS
jgi:hypothetical protein